MGCPDVRFDEKMIDEYRKLITDLESVKKAFGTLAKKEDTRIPPTATLNLSENGILSVHQFIGYSWSLFMPCISDLVKTLQKVAKVETVAPSLRYINVIEYESDDRRITNYVNICPSVQGKLSDMPLDRSRVMIQVPSDSPKGMRIIDVGPGKEGIFMEVGFISEKMPISDMGAWYDEAHKAAKDLFRKGAVKEWPF